MLRGAMHIAVVVSFLWLPLNRQHNIVLVYPVEDVGLWADGVYVPSQSWRRDVQRKAVELGMNATYRSSRSKFASSMIGRPPLPDLTSHVVVPSHILEPGQWTGGAAALDTARPFQAIDNALQARIQWDVLVR